MADIHRSFTCYRVLLQKVILTIKFVKKKTGLVEVVEQSTVEPRHRTSPLLRPLPYVSSKSPVISLFYNLVNPTTP